MTDLITLHCYTATINCYRVAVLMREHQTINNRNEILAWPEKNNRTFTYCHTSNKITVESVAPAEKQWMTRKTSQQHDVLRATFKSSEMQQTLFKTLSQ